MTRFQKAHTALVILALSLFVLATGCGDGGPPRAAVEGTVSFDGAPVDGGRIMFIPTDKKGVPANAEITAGKYALPEAKGPSIGTHKVEIVWYKKTGREIDNPSDPGNKMEEKEQLLPKKYNKNSAMREEVKAGKNKFDYKLESR